MNFRKRFEFIIKKAIAFCEKLRGFAFAACGKLHFFRFHPGKNVAAAVQILLPSVLIMAMTLGLYSQLFGNITEVTVTADVTESVDAISRIGSSGKEVCMIQKKLKELGLYNGALSGVYDLETSKAVRKFQQKNGILSNGAAGARTLCALGMYSLLSSCEYRTGSSGEVVLELQKRLSSLGYYDGQITGSFGCLTASAVRRYQKSQEMRENGVADFELLCKIGVFCASVSNADRDEGGNADASGYAVGGSAGGATFSGGAYFSDVAVLSGDAASLNVSGYSAASDSFSAKLELLASFISYEAESEPYLVKLGIGCVVMNRVQSESFPDTVSGVIRELAMTGKKSGADAYFSGKMADESSYNAAYAALSGCNCDPSGGALYYRRKDSFSLLSFLLKNKSDGISADAGDAGDRDGYLGKFPLCRIYGVDFYK